MRKLLTATTALALVGGAAFAELSMSGDAEFGTDYTSEPDPGMSKHSFVHEVGIDFSGSGTTDGGLSFGGSAGFDTGDDVVNTGTVFISGAFGKLTTGDNDAADLTAGGIADVGLNGIGVDDVVEGLRGGTAAQLRYDNSFGAISIAVSAGTTDGTEAVEAKKGLWTLDDLTTGEVGVSITSLSALHAFDNALEFIASQANGPDTAKFLPDPPAEGTDPFAAARQDGFVFEITRTPAKGETIEMVKVASAGTDATDIAGLSRKDKDSSVLGADGKALDPSSDADQIAMFAAYVAAYDLGPDGKVGGGDDTPKAELAALLNQVTAPVEAMGAVPSDSQYAFGMSFEASGVTVGVGYDSDKTVSMGLGFSTGDISSNLLYVRTDDDTTGMGGDLSYTMGASTLTLAYAQRKPDAGETTDAMGINVSHDLGGGAKLVAGFGDVEDVSKASVGLSFTF